MKKPQQRFTRSKTAVAAQQEAQISKALSEGLDAPPKQSKADVEPSASLSEPQGWPRVYSDLLREDTEDAMQSSSKADVEPSASLEPLPSSASLFKSQEGQCVGCDRLKENALKAWEVATQLADMVAENAALKKELADAEEARRARDSEMEQKGRLYDQAVAAIKEHKSAAEEWRKRCEHVETTMAKQLQEAKAKNDDLIRTNDDLYRTQQQQQQVRPIVPISSAKAIAEGKSEEMERNAETSEPTSAKRPRLTSGRVDYEKLYKSTSAQAVAQAEMIAELQERVDALQDELDRLRATPTDQQQMDEPAEEPVEEPDETPIDQPVKEPDEMPIDAPKQKLMISGLFDVL